MNVGVKLTAFAAASATLFGLAFGVGSVLDPIVSEDEVATAETAGDAHDSSNPGNGGESTAGANPIGAPLPGLAVSARGFTLRVADVTLDQGQDVEVAFSITGPDGAAVREFDTVHEKPMHLIVVRRDMSAFQHLHPDRDADGTWRSPVDLSDAGVYRIFADFSPSALGETLTLGTDVFVPGDHTPAELPGPGRAWSSDGYEVTLAGTPVAGAESELAFTVTRDGEELTDVESYLGAFGHLVSLRSGDLAYLHTHPAEETTAGQLGGPVIRFSTTFPTAGRYRLYLNFAHAGEVRTAEYTVEVPAGAGPAPAAPASDDHDAH